MLQNLRIGIKKRRNGKSDVSVKQRGSWPKNIQKLKEKQKNSILATFGKLVSACAINLKPEEREFVADSGASMHMISKKDLNSAELEIVTTWGSPGRFLQPMVKCRRIKRHSLCQRIGHILDNESPRGYASSFIARKALR